MRMEELNDNNFIKQTDTVERHLLELVRNYFKDGDGAADQRTQEYIIQKAVQRMKEELDIDNAGVVSINGQTGDIEINCETLGAEPLIEDKKTAFNKDFGTEHDTVCMGNDPRLSDRRIPKAHAHTIDEINGLSAEISRLSNMIDMLGNSGHSHDNRTALDKITYTGNSREINLDALEDICNAADAEIQKADAKIEYYTSKLDLLIQKAESLGIH